MRKTNNTKKIATILALSLFMGIGAYNAFVINSDSLLGNVSFVKRLDESFGIVTPGRQVAGSVSWKKLSPVQVEIAAQPVQQYKESSTPSSTVVAETAGALQEELNLNLTEVLNPKKYAQGLSASEFSGSLQTNHGVIESLTVSLPNGEGVSVSFSEMAGNVFEYDFDGNVYSGMLYQVDSEAYMVTLTNGPLEGMRMRFSPEAQVEQTQPDMPSAELAAIGVQTATFGSEQGVTDQSINTDALSENDVVVQKEMMSAQAFNMSSI